MLREHDDSAPDMAESILRFSGLCRECVLKKRGEEERKSEGGIYIF
jgi:hypothetical protein